MSPTSHIRSAPLKVLAPASLTEVIRILPEESMAISGAMNSVLSPTCANNGPAVSSIWTSVPKHHSSMTTTFKHLKSHKVPPMTKMLGGLTISPTMQAIVVDCVSIIDPQFAAIIGYNAVSVMACSEDSHASCPAHSKVITASKARPFASCVAIVHHLIEHNRLGYSQKNKSFQNGKESSGPIPKDVPANHELNPSFCALVSLPRTLAQWLGHPATPVSTHIGQKEKFVCPEKVRIVSDRELAKGERGPNLGC